MGMPMVANLDYKKNIHSTNEIGKEARFEGREEKLKG